ncbi:MAG TPA: O-antigen ligase family protein [Opitutus sp.]|nr:O-antigen ligase family protein [Opitutus sp.]
MLASWAGGGRLTWTPAAMLVVAALGLPAVWLQWRERGQIRLRALLPLLLWLAMLGIGLANPSYILSDNGDRLPRPGWISWLPSTVDRAMAVDAAFPWLVALLEGGIIFAVRPSPRFGRVLWAVATANGFVLAAVGAAFRFSHATEMLGFLPVPEPDYFFATFFYKNHWAAYGALCATAGLTLALDGWDRAVAGDARARGRTLFFSAIGLLTLVTLPLPRSRSGALFALLLLLGWVAGLVTGLGAKRAGAARGKAITAAVLIALAGVIVGYGANAYRPRAQADMERTVRQLATAEHGAPVDLRWLASIDTARMAMLHPWLGWGVGSFPVVFPLLKGNYLRDANGHATARFEFAHDDWLQLWAETGIVGMLVLLVPVWFLSWRAWHRGSAARRILGGCALIAAYAWVDFPFNNPAVLLLWTMLLATAALERARRPAYCLAPE